MAMNRQSLILLLIIVFLSTFLPNLSDASNLRLTIDANPLAVFYSPQVTDFAATNSDKKRRADNGVFVLPGLRTGITLSTKSTRYGFAIGYGRVEDVPHLFSSKGRTFDGEWTLVETTLSFYRGRWMIGPQLALIRFTQLDWYREDRIEFSPTSAFMAGVNFSTGSSHVKLDMNLDFLTGARFRAKGKNGWSSNESHLNLNGIGFSLGLRVFF